jgi:hypothetical protein
MNIERDGLLMMDLQKRTKKKKNKVNGTLKGKGCHEGKPK